MAFDLNGLSEVRALNYGRRYHAYDTTDTLSEVLAAGYFDAGWYRLGARDRLDIEASDGRIMAVVSAASSSGVTITASTDVIPANPLVPGSVARSVADVLKDRLSAKSWLTVTDGSADQSTQMASAITAAAGDGKQLWLPGDVICRLDSPLSHTSAPLDLIIDGKVLLPEQAGAFYVAPATSASTTVSAISNVEYPASSGRYVTRLTVASTSGWARNATAFLAGTNNYTADTNLAHKVAEILPVLYVDTGNSYIYLAGQIADTPTGTITLRRLGDYAITIGGRGSIEYRSDAWSAADGLQTGYGGIVLEGCVNASVKAKFRNLLGVGLRTVSSVGCDIDIVASDLRNNQTNQYLGYAGIDTCASRWNRWHIRARNVRHAYTNVMYDRPGYPLWDAGAPRGNIISGIAINATSAAWDTHPGAYDTVFENIHVRGAVMDDQSPSGAQYAVQDRGCNTTVDGLTIIGPQINLLYNSGHEIVYGRDNVLTLRRVLARNTDTSHKPALFVGTSRTFEAGIRKETVFDGLNAYYYDIPEIVGAAAPIKIINSRIILPTLLRIGGNNDITLDNLYLETNASTEPFGIKASTTVFANNITHSGQIFLASLFQVAASAAGSLMYDNVRILTAGVALYSLASGATITLTRPRTVHQPTSINSNPTLTAAQGYGLWYDNTGAGAVRTLNLPAALVGMEITMTRNNATYAVRMDPNGSEVIAGGGAGKYIELQTDKMTVVLRCFIAGNWTPLYSFGTAAFET